MAQPFLTDKELNTIRGKALVGAASPTEILHVFEHLDALEDKLDEADSDDAFGPDGWRAFFGRPG